MPKREKRQYFQDSLFDEFRADTCYVCCGKIPPNKGVCVGQGLWRHGSCKPGSRKWSQSRHAARSAQTRRS